jgi:membrane-associated phospholipid phosphatase
MKLSAVDNLSLIFIGALAIPAVACHAPLGGVAGVVLGVLLLLAVTIVGTAWWAGWSALGTVAHDFSPALLLPVLFNTLGPVIDCVNPQRWDPTFARLDGVVFGSAAFTWHHAFGRPSWLTDLTYVLYVSYYVLPVVLAVLLHRRSDREQFQEFVFAIVMCFYVTYVGYVLFPTLGPRIPPDAEAAVLGGGVVSDVIRAFLHFAERTQTDAFPSGHTAVALVCLLLGWRMLPRSRVPLGLVVGGIIFTTVYLHYHYVVDVAAGTVLGLAIPVCARGLHHVLEPRLVRRWVTQLLSSER